VEEPAQYEDEEEASADEAEVEVSEEEVEEQDGTEQQQEAGEEGVEGEEDDSSTSNVDGGLDDGDNDADDGNNGMDMAEASPPVEPKKLQFDRGFGGVALAASTPIATPKSAKGGKGKSRRKSVAPALVDSPGESPLAAATSTPGSAGSAFKSLRGKSISAMKPTMASSATKSKSKEVAPKAKSKSKSKAKVKAKAKATPKSKQTKAKPAPKRAAPEPADDGGEDGAADDEENPADMSTMRTTERADDRSRRSGRARMAPCEFWKGEKVVYGDEEVHKIKPKTPAELNRVRKRHKITTKKPSTENSPPTSSQKSSKTQASSSTPSSTGGQFYGKEKTSEKPLEPCEVIDWTTGAVGSDNEEAQFCKIALAKNLSQAEWRNIPKNDSMKLCKTFSLTTERWSSGLLELEKGGEKPQQSTKHNFLVFLVLTGTLEVTIHDTTMKCTTGSSFFVPPLNYYSLTNVGKSTSRLSFTQVKIETDA
jgi:centromere protein C